MEHLTEKQKIQEEFYSFPYHYLDLAVDEYKLIYRVLANSRISVVKDLLRPFDGQLVLDAGCGDGRFCYEMNNESVKVVGVDISESALAFARAFNPEVEFYRQDLKNLSLPYRFDSIVMMEALEHIVPEEIPAVLENLHKALHSNGHLIITVPSMVHPVEDRHYQHFSEESLKSILESRFRVIKCVGHIKHVHLNGFGVRLFWALRKIGGMFYSCLASIRKGKELYQYMNRYFEAHIAIGRPDKCVTIIAVAEKI